MIVKVDQTSHNLGNKFEIKEGTTLLYTGKTPLYSSSGDIQLFSADNSPLYCGRYKTNSLLNSFTIINILRKHRSDIYGVYDQSSLEIAEIYHESKKIAERSICLRIGTEEYQLYILLRGRKEILLVYQGNEQIGQVISSTFTVNLKNSYTVFLLNEYQDKIDIICLSILYYDHQNHSDSGKMEVGVSTIAAWNYSKGNELYDPSWMNQHFPHIKIEPLQVNVNYNRKMKRIMTLAPFLFILLWLAILVYFIIFREPFEILALLFILFGVDILRWIRHSLWQ
ncbi:MAG: hypothetical protein ACRC3H_01345 [Lachnospiraceae bacterium]